MNYFFAYSRFSRVALPEEEGAFRLRLLLGQGQRQGLVMTAALMEGLKLGCQLEKTENDVVFKPKACLCFTQLK